MKKFFVIIILSVIKFSAIAQINSINLPYYRNYEYNIYKDSLKHTQIKPYFYLKPTSKIANSYIDISIASYNSNIGFETKNNNFSGSLIGGVDIKSKFFNNFYFNLRPYYGFYKPLIFYEKYIDSLNIIPGIGKNHRKRFFTYQNFNIIGNFTYKPANYIYFEIGNGKTFLGDGYRSILLSDFPASYPYFRTIVEAWKVKYLYQISRNKGFDYRINNSDLFKKYIFTHFLSFNICKRFNISLFETLIQTSHDSILAPRGIEINYLNPVIFLRSVEYNIGSPDNVLIGISGNLKIFKSGLLYGQFFIDEFILSHIKSKKQYWDEKYGIQAGLKFYNTFGIKKFYTQLEFNGVRPYTYSHYNVNCAYMHLNQPLAHPLGANFIEGIAILEYKLKKLNLAIKLVYSKYGENDSLNYGRNPELNYNTRISDENISWLQGNKTNLKYAEISASYNYKNTTKLTLSLAYRSINNSQKNTNNLIIMFKFGTPFFFNNYYDWN